jgi:hypothetical protein
LIGARSLAFGQGDPVTANVVEPGAGAGPPMPTTIEGTDWARVPVAPSSNAIELRLQNIAGASIDGRRARLDGHVPLRVTLTSDGAGTADVVLPLGGGATVALVSGGGAGWTATVSRTGVRFSTAAGTATYEVQPG